MNLRMACLVTLLAVVALGRNVARADAFAEGVLALAASDSEEVKLGIQRIFESADPRALATLTAMKEGGLRVDPARSQVALLRGGELRDVLDDKVISCADCRDVPLNNAIRRALSSVLSQLELSAPDVKVRRAAAEALLATPGAMQRSVVEGALARESDADVKQTLSRALTQMDLESSDPTIRKAAVIQLGETGDLAFKARLERFLEKDVDGAFVEKDADVRGAALGVLSSLRWTETVTRLVGDLLYGLSLGSILLLAALGLAITFGLMGVINMAHGEMLMLGAYVTYVVQIGFQRYAPLHFDWYVLVSLPLAFAVCALIGMGIERSMLRFLYGRPLETLLATWGVSLGLIQTVRLVFGAQNVAVAAPSWLSGGYALMQGIVLPYNRMAIVAFGACVLVFVWAVLTRSRLGLDVRAVTQNRAMAACMGIRTDRVDMWTFGIGSGVAGLGGVALSQIGNVGPELGQGYIVDSFMVVVLGGVGKLAGTVVGAFGLGIINKLLEPVSGAVLGKILVLMLIILFIQKRPQGIFALKGRMAEG